MNSPHPPCRVQDRAELAVPFPFLSADREAPKKEFCPSKVFATSTESSGPITWSEPRFSDNVGITKVMKSHTSGQTFLLGTYNVYYTAEDAAGNRAQCRFEVQLTRKSSLGSSLLE